jgi:non-homologous end joining protein Ku
MPSSVWRGSIVLSLISIPGQLYAAATEPFKPNKYQESRG